MKKFLAMIMVVAMVSFLFVGCMPSVTPPVEEEEEEVEVAKTDTPYITKIGTISLSATTTQYVIAEPAVSGVGVAGAIIKVYVDGVQSGVGSTGATGAFDDILMSMITLTEGVRKLYITATVPGLAESDKSTEYTFTYDKTAPTLASAVGDSSASSLTVTFSEDVSMALSTSIADWPYSALNYARWKVDGSALGDVVITKVSDKVVRITYTIVAKQVYYIGCKGVKDVAGKEITTESIVTFIGIP